MRVLLVGATQSKNVTEASKMALAHGAKISHVEDPEVALEALRNGRGAELVLVDVRLDIASFIQSLRAERMNPVVMGFGIGQDADAAVKAIQAGAREYIPFPPEAELIAAILEAVSGEDVALIYKDPAMADVLALSDRIAPSDASVLITGESGTGKEVMARYIHNKSRRRHQPFISVNCAAIPDTLLESELFGHEKGAFTGAIARRIGKFEEAQEGTLLLDEISEMHPHLQAKLLRAIQEREIERVGGQRPIKVNIRLIATSNRNLEEEVKTGNFREDLYYRLNVIHLMLPPLRERPLDIQILAEHFIKKYTETNQLPVRKLAPETMKVLLENPWRGNVRALENTMHRAVLLAHGEVVTPDVVLLPAGGGMPEKTVQKSSGKSVGSLEKAAESEEGFQKRTVSEVERELIIGTLDYCVGNRTHAAKILGISIRTLRNKLNRYMQEGTVIVPET